MTIQYSSQPLIHFSLNEVERAERILHSSFASKPKPASQLSTLSTKRPVQFVRLSAVWMGSRVMGDLVVALDLISWCLSSEWDWVGRKNITVFFRLKIDVRVDFFNYTYRVARTCFGTLCLTRFPCHRRSRASPRSSIQMLPWEFVTVSPIMRSFL